MKRHNMNRFLFAFILVVGTLISPALWAAKGDHLKYLPVQDMGRIKPFDTFARESLSLLWGKESYKGKPATDVVFLWMMAPEEWSKHGIFQIRHAGLREALKLEEARIYYSEDELVRNPRVGMLIQDLRSKRQNKEKLDPFFQAVQTLESQLNLFHAIRLGVALNIMPSDLPAEQNPTGRWVPIAELQSPYKDTFASVIADFAQVVRAKVALSEKKTSENKDKLAEAREALEKSVEAYIAQVNEKFPDYADRSRVNAEVHYNEFHPFMWAWICYLMAAILFGAVLFGGRGAFAKFAWGILLLGFLLHTYGFGLRVYIIQRAPVTNMYETVVWVAWGSIVIASILTRFWRNYFLVFAAAAVATLCLILCDLSSHVLDGSLTPLEPVLRDNFWLLTHVLTITLSYAAFFLAFVVGDLCIAYYLRGEKKFQKQISEAANAMYRAIQVGVVLLAAGTILGGIWADYSWGRFWGWDPKETWAFIALMGYLAVLHGRLAGWLRNFGLAITSVVTFSLVIMAWYGVNFVLGAGLHTYGFGAGGVEYVAAFVAAHLLYAIYAGFYVHSARKSQS